MRKKKLPVCGAERKAGSSPPNMVLLHCCDDPLSVLEALLLAGACVTFILDGEEEGALVRAGGETKSTGGLPGIWV